MNNLGQCPDAGVQEEIKQIQDEIKQNQDEIKQLQQSQAAVSARVTRNNSSGTALYTSALPGNSDWGPFLASSGSMEHLETSGIGYYNGDFTRVQIQEPGFYLISGSVTVNTVVTAVLKFTVAQDDPLTVPPYTPIITTSDRILQNGDVTEIHFSGLTYIGVGDVVVPVCQNFDSVQGLNIDIWRHDMTVTRIGN